MATHGQGGGWWGDTPMHVVKPYVVTYAVFRLYHPPSRSKNDRCSPMCGYGECLECTKKILFDIFCFGCSTVRERESCSVFFPEIIPAVRSLLTNDETKLQSWRPTKGEREEKKRGRKGNMKTTTRGRTKKIIISTIRFITIFFPSVPYRWMIEKKAFYFCVCFVGEAREKVGSN